MKEMKDNERKAADIADIADIHSGDSKQATESKCARLSE
jgi:hypothetical protein